MDPPGAQPKLLNKALLSDIASVAVEKQLKSAWRSTNKVADLYMLDKLFNGQMLRHVEEYDSAELSEGIVSLHSANKESSLELDPKLFSAILEHSDLVIPTRTVALKGNFEGDLLKLKLTGIESLNLVRMTWPGGNNLDHLLRIITENKASLKKLLGIPEALFGQLPEGLVLDEFSTSNVKPRDVKIPALNTKVFKYTIADDMKIPLAFMRSINADEIHLQINRLLPDSPKNPRPFGLKPGNDRTKKLRVEFVDDREGEMDFDRMFREVAACCPKLECFELVHKKRFNDYNFTEYTCAVDNLVADFEQAMKEADTAQYKVHLKTYAWYSYFIDEHEETDFSCGLLKTNLPPSEEVDPDKKHSYFVKEMSTEGRNLRVDCEILEGSESDEESDFDDSDLYEAYYDYGNYEDDYVEPYGYDDYWGFDSY